MTPSQNKSATESLALYAETLRGNNTAALSIKAYMGDLRQFLAWLQTRRVDWDIPYRIERIDIVGFINKLASEKLTAVTRSYRIFLFPAPYTALLLGGRMSDGGSEKAILGWTRTSGHGTHVRYANPNHTRR
jgi:hypothetical protein